MRTRQLAPFTAGCRVAIGTAFLAAPQLAMRPWIGRETRIPAARLLARAVGARDLLLALGALTAGDEHERERWLAAGVVADVADLALTVAYRRGLPRGGVALVCVVAAGGVVLGAAAFSDRRSPPPR